MPNPVARSAIPEYSKIKYNNHLIGRMTDTHGGYEEQEVFFDYSTKTSYSNTDYSDWDNIYINRFRNLMVDVQNAFNGSFDDGNIYYLIYTRYLSGNNITEMLDENGELIEIDDVAKVKEICDELNISKSPEEVMNEINQVIGMYNHAPEENDLFNDFRNLFLTSPLDIPDNIFIPDDAVYLPPQAGLERFNRDMINRIFELYINSKDYPDLFDSDYKIRQIDNIDYFRKIVEKALMVEVNGTKTTIHLSDEQLTILMREINKVISKYNNGDHDPDNSIQVKYGMNDVTLVETISAGSGYDAMVFQTPDGDYMIVNCCTNPSQLQDLLAIAYPMANLLLGSDDAVDFILRFLATESSSDLWAQLEDLDSTDLKTYYDNQIQDNVDLIEKYVQEAIKNGTKVQLYGYSLGGGIQEAAYMDVLINNHDLDEYIESVTVYNPFSLYLEQYIEVYINNNEVTDEIKKMFNDLVSSDNSKLLIYSAEEDIVSTFNNWFNYFIDKTVFIESEDVDSKIEKVKQLYDIIIGALGNHGFIHINSDNFDGSGTLTDEGSFVSIEETVSANLENYPNSFGGVNPDLGKLIELILQIPQITEAIEDVRKNPNLNTSKLDDAIEILKEYIENNVGEYDYEEFVDQLCDAAWKFLWPNIEDAASEKSWFHHFGLVHSNHKEDSFKGALKDFLMRDENKNLLIDIIVFAATENDIAKDDALITLLGRFKVSYELSIDDNTMLYNSYINGYIKDGLLEKLCEMFKIDIEDVEAVADIYRIQVESETEEEVADVDESEDSDNNGTDSSIDEENVEIEPSGSDAEEQSAPEASETDHTACPAPEEFAEYEEIVETAAADPNNDY